MGSIIDPNQQRVAHFHDVSKLQLAQEVNRQTAQIEDLRRQINATGRVLLAIVTEPESFKYDDGVCSVDQAAVDRVRKGARLTFDYQGHRVVLAAVVPPPPEEQTRIVLPQRESL